MHTAIHTPTTAHLGLKIVASTIDVLFNSKIAHIQQIPAQEIVQDSCTMLIGILVVMILANYRWQSGPVLARTALT